MTGVVLLPIAPAMFREPLFAALVAESLTEAVALVLAKSIVPAAVVCSREALVATKLNSFLAEDAPVIETVPFAVSVIQALPLPALAIMFETLVVKGETLLVPMLPLMDVRSSVFVLSAPVMVLLNRLL